MVPDKSGARAGAICAGIHQGCNADTGNAAVQLQIWDCPCKQNAGQGMVVAIHAANTPFDSDKQEDMVLVVT